MEIYTSLKTGVTEQINNVNKILEGIFNQLQRRNFASKLQHYLKKNFFPSSLELSIDIQKTDVLITNHCFELIKLVTLNTFIWLYSVGLIQN